jgi:flagellar motor component MotA
MKFLSALSMQAIRATLDGAMVRETQRINNLIVFLTLSISGGPFLGLLGTVVGVMITFAAVAAAGDVNVNAIAPGIAAALLATVAGLAVAIPALFGYNYLLARIKNATSDMHVFIDEFITKAAEFYSKGEITAASTMRLSRPAEVKAKPKGESGTPQATPSTDAMTTPRPSISTVSAIPMKMEISRVDPGLEGAAPGT